MQALVYNLNLHLQKAFIQADIKYVSLLQHGGKGVVLGHPFSIIGMDGAAKLLANLPASPEKAKIADFIHDARLALALTDNAIRATAAPIVLDEEKGRGRTSALSAQAQAYGLAITITFLGLLLAAGALAAERDENVIGRLCAAWLVSAGWSRRRSRSRRRLRWRSGSRSCSGSGLRSRREVSRAGSRGSDCRSCSSASRSRGSPSAPSVRSSERWRGSREPPPSSGSSPCCWWSSSDLFRARSSRPPTG